MSIIKKQKVNNLILKIVLKEGVYHVLYNSVLLTSVFTVKDAEYEFDNFLNDHSRN